MKKSFLVFAFILTCLLFFWLFQYFSSEEKQEENLAEAYQESNSFAQSPSLAHNDTNAVLQQAIAENNDAKSYEEDWCAIELDLKESDVNFAISQSVEWDIARGKTEFLAAVDQKVRLPDKREQMLAPYKHMDEQQLSYLASQNDELALLSALDGGPFTMREKDDFALKLLTLGKTGDAISHLVISNIIEAKLRYQKSGELDDVSLERITDAFMFANFAAEYYDISGIAYFLFAQQKFGKDGTHLLDILKPQDLVVIEQKLVELKAELNKMRVKLHLQPLETIDIPKIAKHDFTYGLAFTYNLAGYNMQRFMELNLASPVSIKKDSCIERQLKTLF